MLIDKPRDWTSHDVVAKVRSTLSGRDKGQGTRRKDGMAGFANQQGEAVRKLPGDSHLDAVQGSNEERMNRRKTTMSERQKSADAAMHQEPAGVTGSASQQGKAVRKLRVGHAGTLDPLATGLLVVLIGSYTKRAQQFTKLDKTYDAKVTLGKVSETDDEEGEKTAISNLQPASSAIEETLKSFIGEIMQMPPQYSAVKVKGQRAYKLARKGQEVKIKPRKIKIYDIWEVRYDYPEINFKVRVSSGTYIRSLARDIGDRLKTGAYLSELRRTAISKYKVDDAVLAGKINHSAISANLINE